MHTTAVVLSAVLSATPSLTQELPDTWSNRASFFVGVRSGLAIPPGASALAPSASLEFGVAPTRGFGMGLRAMWMNAPPGVPFLGLGSARYGFGALADLRVYFETIDPLIIYPTLAVGFLAGPDEKTGLNLVLPLFNPGVGAKLKFGNFYVAFEFGVSGLTIPFMGLCAGYEADSKLDKQRERLARVEAARQAAAEREEAARLAAPQPQAAVPAEDK